MDDNVQFRAGIGRRGNCPITSIAAHTNHVYGSLCSQELDMQRITGLARIATTLAVLTAAATSLSAQSSAVSANPRFEARVFAGALMPTGIQADLLETAFLAGIQAGWKLHPNFSLTSTLGWAPTEDKTTALVGDAFYTGRPETVDAYQYDLGLEARYPIVAGMSWTTTPYLALGGGGRTYRYRDIDGIGAETNPLGFGAIGLDLAPRSQRFAIRIEARDNITGFKGLRGEYVDRKARNDVQVFGGLSYRF